MAFSIVRDKVFSSSSYDEENDSNRDGMVIVRHDYDYVWCGDWTPHGNLGRFSDFDRWNVTSLSSRISSCRQYDDENDNDNENESENENENEINDENDRESSSSSSASAPPPPPPPPQVGMDFFPPSELLYCHPNLTEGGRPPAFLALDLQRRIRIHTTTTTRTDTKTAKTTKTTTTITKTKTRIPRPEYSIVMPSHNVESVLRTTVPLICQQTVGLYELIFILDASYDDSFNALRQMLLSPNICLSDHPPSTEEDPNDIHNTNADNDNDNNHHHHHHHHHTTDTNVTKATPTSMLTRARILVQPKAIFETSSDNMGFLLAALTEYHNEDQDDDDDDDDENNDHDDDRDNDDENESNENNHEKDNDEDSDSNSDNDNENENDNRKRKEEANDDEEEEKTTTKTKNGTTKGPSHFFVEIQADMILQQHGWNFDLARPLFDYDDIFSVSGRCGHYSLRGISGQKKYFVGRCGADIRELSPDLANETRHGVFVVSTNNRGPLLFRADAMMALGYLNEMNYYQGHDDHDLNHRAFQTYGWHPSYKYTNFYSPLMLAPTRNKMLKQSIPDHILREEAAYQTMRRSRRSRCRVENDVPFGAVATTRVILDAEFRPLRVDMNIDMDANANDANDVDNDDDADNNDDDDNNNNNSNTTNNALLKHRAALAEERPYTSSLPPLPPLIKKKSASHDHNDGDHDKRADGKSRLRQKGQGHVQISSKKNRTAHTTGK